MVMIRPKLPNSAQSLEAIKSQWGGKQDLWIFGYASLIWRPEFEFAEQRFATTSGYHRALKMWSTLNRGTPERPGLVFGLLPGGSCKGMVFRIPHAQVAAALPPLWEREMPNAVYEPKWLRCQTLPCQNAAPTTPVSCRMRSTAKYLQKHPAATAALETMHN